MGLQDIYVGKLGIRTQSRTFTVQQPNPSVCLFSMNSTLMPAEQMGTGDLQSNFLLISMPQQLFYRKRERKKEGRNTEDKMAKQGRGLGNVGAREREEIRRREFTEHCDTSEVEGLAPLPLQAQSRCSASRITWNEASAHTETLMNPLYSSISQ